MLISLITKESVSSIKIFRLHLQDKNFSSHK